MTGAAYLLMHREKPVSLQVEQLEERDCPSISIQLDYSHDSSGFFINHPDRESLLSTAANALTSRLGDSLSVCKFPRNNANECERLQRNANVDIIPKSIWVQQLRRQRALHLARSTRWGSQVQVL
jgi:hypothetical protein